MRDNVREFVRMAAQAFDLRAPVYEFGSYQVPGCGTKADLRSFFHAKRYVGCDMRHGPGVDRVEDLGRLTLPDGHAGTIICVDTLEHVFEVKQAVNEMIRVLAPGGMLLVTAPLDFRIHFHPSDYWRLTPACLERLLAPLGVTLVGSQGVESYPHTVFGIGAKTPVSDGFGECAHRFMTGFQVWLERAQRAIGWPERVKRGLRAWATSRGDRRRQREYFSARFVVSMQRMPARVSHLPPLWHSDTNAGTRLDLH